MFKKLLFAAVTVLGLVYGSGHSLSSIAHSVTSTSNDTARGVTATDHGGWGRDSGY